MRWLLGIIAVLLLGAGLVPYAAIPIYWSLGTVPAVLGAGPMAETVLIGTGAPQPDWVVTERGAIRLTASRWIRQTRYKDSGGLEMMTHSSVETLKPLYTRLLKAQGFEVQDHGIGPLLPEQARLLLIGPMLLARHEERRLELSVLIREPEGLFGWGPRIVQIEWRELWPGQTSPFAAMGAFPPAP